MIDISRCFQHHKHRRCDTFIARSVRAGFAGSRTLSAPTGRHKNKQDFVSHLRRSLCLILLPGAYAPRLYICRPLRDLEQHILAIAFCEIGDFTEFWGWCLAQNTGRNAISEGHPAWPLRHASFFRYFRWRRPGCVPPLLLASFEQDVLYKCGPAQVGFDVAFALIFLLSLRLTVYRLFPVVD